MYLQTVYIQYRHSFPINDIAFKLSGKHECLPLKSLCKYIQTVNFLTEIRISTGMFKASVCLGLRGDCQIILNYSNA